MHMRALVAEVVRLRVLLVQVLLAEVARLRVLLVPEVWRLRLRVLLVPEVWRLRLQVSFFLAGVLLASPVFAQNAPPTGLTPRPVKDRPTTGKAVAELEGFDRAMLQFMKERNIPAGTLAVSKDGKLLLSRGHGFS